MSTRLGRIRDQVVHQLGLINGSGSYSVDLSVNGRIILGRALPTGSPCPAVSVAVGELQIEPGPSFGKFSYTLPIELLAWVSSDANTREARLNAACELVADIESVFCASATTRTLVETSTGKALVYDAQVSGVVGDGEDFGYPGVGMVALGITCTWEATSLRAEPG